MDKYKNKLTDDEIMLKNLGLDLDDLNDDGSDLDELRNIMEGEESIWLKWRLKAFGTQVKLCTNVYVRQ
mgnify:CR=1 FL=1